MNRTVIRCTHIVNLTINYYFLVEGYYKMTPFFSILQKKQSSNWPDTQKKLQVEIWYIFCY